MVHFQHSWCWAAHQVYCMTLIFFFRCMGFSYLSEPMFLSIFWSFYFGSIFWDFLGLFYLDPSIFFVIICLIMKIFRLMHSIVSIMYGWASDHTTQAEPKSNFYSYVESNLFFSLFFKQFSSIICRTNKLM